MAQIANDTRQVLPIRPTSKIPTEVTAPMLGQPQIARPWRVIVVLKWLFQMLLVRPVGRRARLEGIGKLSDRALRDIGLMRCDTAGTVPGLAPLQEHPGDHASIRTLAACEEPRHSLTVVRLNQAA